MASSATDSADDSVPSGYQVGGTDEPGLGVVDAACGHIMSGTTWLENFESELVTVTFAQLEAVQSRLPAYAFQWASPAITAS